MGINVLTVLHLWQSYEYYLCFIYGSDMGINCVPFMAVI